jgi:hypothetical protein
LTHLVSQGLNRARRADAPVTHKGDGLALPFKKRAVEGVLENGRRTVIVLGDRCDEGIKPADAFAPGFRFRLGVDAARVSRRRRLIEERQPSTASCRSRRADAPSTSHCTGVSANLFGRVPPTINPTFSMFRPRLGRSQTRTQDSKVGAFRAKKIRIILNVLFRKFEMQAPGTPSIE